MRAEQGPLQAAIGAVVIVVEPCLTDSDDPRVLSRCEESRFSEIRVLLRLVRMDADARPHVGLALGCGHYVSPFALPGGDVPECLHSRISCTAQHGGLVLDQAFVVEVAMAID